MPPAELAQTDIYVLDTSALLWLYLADGPLPPSLEPAIQRGCSWDALLLVPDLCLLECASVLLKQVQRQLLNADECRALLADVLQLPLRLTSSADLAPQRLTKPWLSRLVCTTPATSHWLSSMALP